MRRLTPFHGTRAWKTARQLAKRAADYRCQRCGEFLPGKGELHVHHKMPVAEHPAVALEPLNYLGALPCMPQHRLSRALVRHAHAWLRCDRTTD